MQPVQQDSVGVNDTVVAAEKSDGDVTAPPERDGVGRWPRSVLPGDMVGVWGYAQASHVHRILLTTFLLYRTVVVIAINLPAALTPGVDGPALAAVLLLWTLFNAAIIVARWRPVPDLRKPNLVAALGDMALTVLLCVVVSVMTQPAAGVAAPHHAAGWSAVTATVALWAWIRSVRVGMSFLLLTAPVPAVVAASTGTSLDLRAALMVTAVHFGQTLAALVIVLGLRAMYRAGVDGSHQAGLRIGMSRERIRSIRLMHDNAVQTLESIAMVASLRGPVDHRKLLEQVGRDAADGARELRARLGDAGLTSDDPWEPVWRVVGSARARGQRVEVVLDRRGARSEPPAGVTDAVVGIVQEALTNAWKHSGSTEATVRVVHGADEVTVVVTDEGRGFDVDLTPAGFGLSQSIRARAADAGGWTEVESASGRGTVLRAGIPL
ncbi:MAG: sensor histidine kinase [Dermatophilaceae bacterium]